MRIENVTMATLIMSRIDLHHGKRDKFHSDISVAAEKLDGEWGGTFIQLPCTLVCPKDAGLWLRGLKLAKKLADKIEKQVDRIHRGHYAWDNRLKRHVPRKAS